MLKIVNGASLQPLSGGVPRQIIVLLHGYGSSGSDLISLAPHWRQAMPDALFLAPNAPQRSGPGYQWWPLHGFTPSALAAGAAQAAPAIEAFVDRKLDQYGLNDADLAVIGFSQGTMMALNVGLRRKAAPAAIIGYSGMLVGAPKLADMPTVKPPVLLIHGAADAVVPVSALHAAKAELARLGIEAETHVSTGLGHSVDPTGMRLGVEFLAKAYQQGR